MKLTKSAYNNLFGGFQMDHSINKRIILDRVKKKKDASFNEPSSHIPFVDFG